eukprot:3888556-Alexandrium_andersonii.AAC.1
MPRMLARGLPPLWKHARCTFAHQYSPSPLLPRCDVALSSVALAAPKALSASWHAATAAPR